MASNLSFPTNDQHSPFILNSKDLHSLTNIKKPYRNYRVPFKTQLLNSSLYSTKDQTQQKPLPEILIPEKKPIHGRSSISKTRTLPYIKLLESEKEAKAFEKKIENLNLEAKKIKMKRKVKVSIKNVKFQSIFKPDLQKGQEVEIRITNCEDLQAPRAIVMRTPHHLYTPSGENSSCSSKYTRRGAFGTPSLSPARSDRSQTLKDSFYYLNYLKHLNVTSFFNILDAATDNNLNSFPYYTRIIKKYSKLQQVEKKPLHGAIKAYHPCTCNTIKNEIKIKAKFMKTQKLKHLIPHLQTITFSPQPAEFSNNFIVLNFENVVGSFINEICIKPGILKLIKKLSQQFRIILVTALEDFKLNAVKAFIERQKVVLSGIYRVILPTYPHHELKKMLDYSQIYKDFNIYFPEQQVLIITAHRISDLSDSCEYISTKKGLTQKLNTERPPLPSFEYENCPITILLSNFQVREHLNPIKNLVKLSKTLDSESFPRFFDFRNKISCISDSLIKSNEIHKILISAVKDPKNRFRSGKVKRKRKSEVFCKLHKRSIENFEEIFAVNIFLI